MTTRLGWTPSTTGSPLGDGRLISTLGAGLSISVMQLRTDAEILDAASKFWSSLQQSEEPLPSHYLFKRFHRLATGKANAMTFDRFADQFLMRHPEVERSEIMGWQRPGQCGDESQQ